MTHKEEYWDIWNPDGTHAGIMRKGDGYITAPQYHLTVEIIPIDGKGHILMTRRAWSKTLGGGLLEFPAGSVKAGETAEEAAHRELAEETGLKPQKVQKLCEASVPGMKRIIYTAMIPDLCSSNITLQKTETDNYELTTYQQWLLSICSGQFDVSRTRMYGPQVYNLLEVNDSRLVRSQEVKPQKMLITLPKTLCKEESEESALQHTMNVQSLSEMEGMEYGDSETESVSVDTPR